MVLKIPTNENRANQFDFWMIDLSLICKSTHNSKRVPPVYMRNMRRTLQLSKCSTSKLHKKHQKKKTNCREPIIKNGQSSTSKTKRGPPCLQKSVPLCPNKTRQTSKATAPSLFLPLVNSSPSPRQLKLQNMTGKPTLSQTKQQTSFKAPQSANNE